jgi:hypothetical protein
MVRAVVQSPTSRVGLAHSNDYKNGLNTDDSIAHRGGRSHACRTILLTESRPKGCKNNGSVAGCVINYLALVAGVDRGL